MSEVNVDALRKLIDEAITQWAVGNSPVVSPTNEITEVVDKRVLPKDKRVIRTKSTGDRVYYLDDIKKTRQWVTNPEVLKGLGFEMGDVTDIEDLELQKYAMASALYKVPEEALGGES